MEVYDETQNKWYMLRSNMGVLFAQLFNNQTVQDSTLLPLGALGIYTGAAKACGAYARLVGSVFSDQAGTLYIEQSQDGNNWDISESVAVVANTAAAFTYEVLAPYGRMRYVNGNVAQVVFRLYMNGRSI